MPRYLGGTENAPSNEDIISGSEEASFAGNSNDVAVLTLRANLGILHLIPLSRRATGR